MKYKTLSYVAEDGILTLTLNLPEKLNAFTLEMAGELVEAFNQASDDDEVGAIVVTGAGRAFCAGMDLSIEGNVFGLDESQQPTLEDVAERGEEEHILHGVRDEGGLVTLAIYECKKPVTLFNEYNPIKMALTGIEWFLFKTGTAAYSNLETGGFIRSNDLVD